MAEWSIAPVLKTGVPRGTGGSNPSFSAQKKGIKTVPFFYVLNRSERDKGDQVQKLGSSSKVGD